MRYLLPISIFLILTSIANAQTMSLGEAGSVTYTDMFETDTGTLYYDNETLVLSVHDTDQDGVAETWIQYQDDTAVLEGYDADGVDGPDVFIELTSDESVQRIFGESADTFTKPEADMFDPLTQEGAPSAEEDLVGDVSSITIPGGNNYLLYSVLLLALLGSWYIWRRRKQAVAD